MDINSLSAKELNELIVTANRRKRVLAKRKPIAKVRASIMSLIKSSGYTFEELYGNSSASKMPASKAAKRKGPKPGGKVAPKYANPDNPAETWTGRGKKPKWLEEKVSNGQPLDAFLIHKDEKEPPAEHQHPLPV